MRGPLGNFGYISGPRARSTVFHNLTPSTERIFGTGGHLRDFVAEIFLRTRARVRNRWGKAK